MDKNHHYFTDNTDLRSELKTIEYTIHGKKLSLFSDNGVFSGDRVDFGTNVLINNIVVPSSTHTILDIGCGYGIIGIAFASSFPDITVTMSDVSLRALELTNKNIQKNKLSNCFVIESDRYLNIEGKFDMIISNPPIRAGKQIVHDIIESGKNYLNDQGTIWVVIQKKQGANSLINKMDEVFGNVTIVAKEKGYYVAYSKNTKC